MRDWPVMRRVATVAAVVVVVALAVLGVLIVVAAITSPGTKHFRGRDFEDAGFCHAGAFRRYRVPIRGWPGLRDGQKAFAIQTVRTAFPTDVLVLTRNGHCVSQWALKGGP